MPKGTNIGQQTSLHAAGHVPSALPLFSRCKLPLHQTFPLAAAICFFNCPAGNIFAVYLCCPMPASVDSPSAHPDCICL